MLALLGAGAIAWWLFAADRSRPGGRIASYQTSHAQKSHALGPVDSTPFRYGPEVNHGRGDTPVGAREQALRNAGEARDARAEFYRPARERRGSRAATESFLNRGLKSGH